jgi:hypothetical protein
MATTKGVRSLCAGLRGNREVWLVLWVVKVKDIPVQNRRFAKFTMLWF